MRQGNGAELLGANDPRSATIGMIDVNPDDDRESVLAAILTQEKLGRKQIAIVLPSQNKSFQRPFDFERLKDMRRKLQAELIVIAPGGSSPAEFARQRRFLVFSSRESYARWLQDQGQGEFPRRGGFFGRRSRPQAASNGAASNRSQVRPFPLAPGDPEPEPLPPSSAERDEQAAFPSSQGENGAVAAGSANNGIEDEDTHALAPTNEQPDENGMIMPLPVMPFSSPSAQDTASSPAQDEPAQENGQSGVAPGGASHAQADRGPGIIELSPRRRDSQPVPIPPVAAVPSVEPGAPSTAVPPRQRNAGNPPAAGAGAPVAAAGGVMGGRAAMGGAPPTQVGSRVPPAPPPRAPRRRNWIVALVVLLVLSVLLCGGIAVAAPGTFGSFGSAVSHVITGAVTATVTITPDSKKVQDSFVITAVTGTPNASQRQVQARLLTYTTSPQSKTAAATGTGHTPGARATGTLTFYNGSTSPFTVGAGNLMPTRDGVAIVTDAAVTIPAANPPNFGVATMTAHAVNVGTSGNIAALDIDGTCCTAGNYITVKNFSAFSGGQNPQTYTVVQQSDVNGLANPLKTQQAQAAQAGINSQKHTGEQFAAQLQCTTNVVANPPVGSKASSVTVTVTATCNGEVYDQSGAQALAAQLLKNEATKNLGTSYALVGNLVTSQPQVTSINSKTRTVALLVNAQGIWVYQFTDAQKAQLAKLIAGKTSAQAQALLLRQPGVSKVDSINISSGDILPTDPSQITIIIQSVAGLPGTPTPSPASPTPGVTPTEGRG